ncbi:MAG: cupredoxin family copper-binding protein [Solirubrobacterales bacterium]
MAIARDSLRRGWRWAATIAALALMVVALAGLRATVASAGAQPRPTPNGAAARPGAEARRAGGQVEIENFAYKPGTLRISTGTRVLFVNRDSVTHTVTRSGGFDSGRLSPGESFAFRFKRAGTFRFHCKIHSFMHGKIVVG